MKILYFAHTVLCRGGDKVVLAHLGHLAEKGHQVTIKTSLLDTVFKVHPDIIVELLPDSTKVGTLTAALFDKQGADCIIATILPTACALYFRNRHKVVLLAQEYDELAYTNPMIRVCMQLLGFLGLKKFRIPVIAVSRELATGLERRFKCKIEVVENGIDSLIFYPDPEYLAMKEQKPAILLFARSDARKGFDLAVRVIEHFRTVWTDSFEVWIIGDCACPEMVGVPTRLFGFVPEGELRKIFSSADIFLYPSRTDGYSLIVAEAFACKCPVVTTTAVPIARNGVTALVSKPDDIEGLADRMCILLTDKQVRTRIVDEAYHFSREHTAQMASCQFETALLNIRSQHE